MIQLPTDIINIIMTNKYTIDYQDVLEEFDLYEFYIDSYKYKSTKVSYEKLEYDFKNEILGDTFNVNGINYDTYIRADGKREYYVHYLTGDRLYIKPIERNNYEKKFRNVIQELWDLKNYMIDNVLMKNFPEQMFISKAYVRSIYKNDLLDQLESDDNPLLKIILIYINIYKKNLKNGFTIRMKVISFKQ